MKHRTILAGAEQARKYLALNLDNRPLSNIRVEHMCQGMLRGEWRESTDMIGIEGEGSAQRLINGQHRLEALCRADERQPGIRIPLTIATELGPDSAQILDTGKSRSLEDTLFFLGESEAKPKALSAVLNLAWHIDHETYVSREPTPTRPQLTDFLKNHPDIRDAVPYGMKVSRGAHVPAAGVMGACWLIGQGANVEWLEQFVSEVAYGENLATDDMTYQLRELYLWWLTKKLNETRGRPWKVCAITITTWNAWLTRTRRDLRRVKITEIPTPL